MKKRYVYAGLVMAAFLSVIDSYAMAGSVARRATGAGSRAYSSGSNAVDGQMRIHLAQPRSQVTDGVDRLSVVDRGLQPSIDAVRALKMQLQQAKELSAQMTPLERTAGDYDRKIEAMQERVRRADQQLMRDRVLGLAEQVDTGPLELEDDFESRLLEE